MELEQLAEQNPWWKHKSAVETDYDIEKWKAKKHTWFPPVLDKVSTKPFALHILLGPRQAGKTTAVKLLIRRLLSKREPKSLFYFNCEMLADFKELRQVIETYLEFKADHDIKTSLIILDEVTAPREWYRAIKSLIDLGKLRSDTLLLTGSSSIAIKREVELFPGRRGHGQDLVLFPLSFREFLKVLNPDLYHKIQPFHDLSELRKRAAQNALYLKELNLELKKYLTYGGFPLSIEAISGSREEAKRAYLSWIKTAILKSGRNDTIARQILGAVVERMPGAMSWEGVSKEIEIKSPKTVAAYIDLLQSLFALLILHNVDISSKKIKFGKNKKVHVIDPLLFEIFEDWCLLEAKDRESTLAESAVAAHLSRLHPGRVFFWRDGFEIDALLLNKTFKGFEVKWGKRPEARMLPQLESLTTITKTEFRKEPLRIPLAVFLAMLEV